MEEELAMCQEVERLVNQGRIIRKSHNPFRKGSGIGHPPCPSQHFFVFFSRKREMEKPRRDVIRSEGAMETEHIPPLFPFPSSVFSLKSYLQKL